MPEHITTNATRNVTNWIPKALCAYSAAPAACILGDKLEIAERGDGGDQKGDQERNPCCPTDFGGDVTSQGIHTGAEDVADDEQQKQSGTITRRSSGCFSAVWLMGPPRQLAVSTP
jgi:hypothetical protein